MGAVAAALAPLHALIEAQGDRVGIISQPDWRSAEPFAALGRPNLFLGVTAGNMDSMVNHYTAARKLRHDDAYTQGGRYGRRPDRAVIVYSNLARAAYRGAARNSARSTALRSYH